MLLFSILLGGKTNAPGEETDQLAHLLPHGRGASAQVVLKEFTDEALQDQNLPQGRVGGQRAEQSDAVSRYGRGAAVALVGGGVAAAQHGERSVLAGCEGGLVAAAARRLGGCLPLLQVVLQELFTRRQHFL